MKKPVFKTRTIVCNAIVMNGIHIQDLLFRLNIVDYVAQLDDYCIQKVTLYSSYLLPSVMLYVVKTAGLPRAIIPFFKTLSQKT